MRVQRTNRKKRGAALVEYGLIVAGVAMVTAVAVSVFGHKINDMMGTSAAILPSSDIQDTGPITGGRLIRTSGGGGSTIQLGQDADQSTLQEMFGVDVDELIEDTPNSTN